MLARPPGVSRLGLAWDPPNRCQSAGLPRIGRRLHGFSLRRLCVACGLQVLGPRWNDWEGRPWAMKLPRLQPTNQPTHRLFSQPFRQLTIQPTNQRSYQPSNQPVNQTTRMVQKTKHCVCHVECSCPFFVAWFQAFRQHAVELHFL